MAHSKKRGLPPVTCCEPPSDPPQVVKLPDGHVVVKFSAGEMGGEKRPFVDRDTGETHLIDTVRVGGGDGGGGDDGGGDDGDGGDGGQTRHIPLESFLDMVHTAAYMGVKRATLYSWVPYLQSAEKRGSRLIFWTDVLVNIDIPQLESRLRRRADIEAERRERAAMGEVVRPGRHAHGCLKTHEGPCGPPRPTSPRRGKRKK